MARLSSLNGGEAKLSLFQQARLDRHVRKGSRRCCLCWIDAVIITNTVYICDECKKEVEDTKEGKMFGALCFKITAPKHTTSSLEVHFCCLNHSIKWMQRNIGSVVLT